MMIEVGMKMINHINTRKPSELSTEYTWIDQITGDIWVPKFDNPSEKPRQKKVWQCLGLGQKEMTNNPIVHRSSFKKPRCLMIIKYYKYVWIILPEISRIVMYQLVPHKSVAEVSKIGHYGTGELLRCTDDKANPLMDRKVIGVVLFWSGCSGHLNHNCWM